MLTNFRKRQNNIPFQATIYSVYLFEFIFQIFHERLNNFVVVVVVVARTYIPQYARSRITKNTVYINTIKISILNIYLFIISRSEPHSNLNY